MSAAIEAARLGCRVTLVDEASRPGGQIYRQSHPDLSGPDVAEPSELARKTRLLSAYEAVRARIDYRPNTAAYALIDPGEVHLSTGEATEVLAADAVVIATGVREIAAPFPGWTIPGVMYAGGAQSLIKAQRVLPGRRVVVAGAGPLPLVVASQILRAGGSVVAIAPLHPLTVASRHVRGLWRGRDIVLEGLRYLSTVLRARVPRWTGFVPVRALGTEQVEAVVLARLGADGPEPGTETEIACDAVAVNYGFASNSELVAMAGAKMRYDRLTGGWLPAVDEFGRTSVPAVFVAGDMAALRGALVAEIEGRIVGAAAACDPMSLSDLPRTLADGLASRQRLYGFQNAVRATLRTPPALWNLATEDTTICRCENVTLGGLRFALDAGHHVPNAIKRATRVGMGWCGGRTCLPTVTALAEYYAGVAPEQMMTPRPLARPVPLAALARRTRA
jgi:NADPH-dependent 2,4-dienoyl-CoA reductase/sulfur reductase-like enzyme